MDIRKVKKLIELLDESGIAEIEITEGEESVRISRYPQGTAVTQIAPQPPMSAQCPRVSTGSPGLRGGRSISSPLPGPTPSASAGSTSVSTLR